MRRPVSLVFVAAAACLIAAPASAQKPPPIPKGNHYVCHPAKVEKFAERKASFADQFGAIDVVVTGITRVCTPAEKRYNNQITPVVDKSLHLVCYSIKPSQAQKLPKVLTNDQFGPETIVLAQPNEICLPAGKLPLK